MLSGRYIHPSIRQKTVNTAIPHRRGRKLSLLLRMGRGKEGWRYHCWFAVANADIECGRGKSLPPLIQYPVAATEGGPHSQQKSICGGWRVGRYSYLMSTVDTSPNISQIYLSRCLDRFTGLPTPPRPPLFPMQDVSSNKSEQCIAMKQPAPPEVCHFGRHICTAHKPLRRREVFHLRHAAEGAKSKELILLVRPFPLSVI